MVNQYVHTKIYVLSNKYYLKIQFQFVLEYIFKSILYVQYVKIVLTPGAGMGNVQE